MMDYAHVVFRWLSLLCCGLLGLRMLRGALRMLLLFCFERVAVQRTGQQRRAVWPPDVPMNEGAAVVLTSGAVEVQREFMTTRSGDQIFYQVVSPPAGESPSRMLFFVHGYRSSSDVHLEALAEVAKAGTLTVALDVPGHGRSDGLWLYVADWWEYVESIWEFFDGVVEPLRRSRSTASVPLPLFAAGHSMGGSIILTLAHQRPAAFDGLIGIEPLIRWPIDLYSQPVLTCHFWCRRLQSLRLSWPMKGFSFNTDHVNVDRIATRISSHYVYARWLQEHATELRTPLLVLQGLEDGEAVPQFAFWLVQKAGSADKELKLFEDIDHKFHIRFVPDLLEFMALRSRR